MTQFNIAKFKDDDFEMDVNISPINNNIWLSSKEISLFNNILVY